MCLNPRIFIFRYLNDFSYFAHLKMQNSQEMDLYERGFRSLYMPVIFYEKSMMFMSKVHPEIYTN